MWMDVDKIIKTKCLKNNKTMYVTTLFGSFFKNNEATLFIQLLIKITYERRKKVNKKLKYHPLFYYITKLALTWYSCKHEHQITLTFNQQNNSTEFDFVIHNLIESIFSRNKLIWK